MHNENYDYYEHSKIENLRELILLNIKRNPNFIAFKYKEDNEIVSKTYEEFYNDIIVYSKIIKKKFKNKHIALIGENSYRWLITFFSIIFTDNVVVVIDKDIDNEKLKQLMKKTDTKIIIYSKKYCPNIEKTKYEKIGLEDIEFINNYDSFDISRNTNNKKDAVIFFTSGTTGDNKAVVLSEYNIASDIYSSASLFKLDGNVVSFLPFHHSFGLITSVLKVMFYGKEIYINNSYKYLINDIKYEQPETLFMVPAFVSMLYKRIWKQARLNHNDLKLKKMIKLSNMLLKINIDIRDKLFKNIKEEFGKQLKYIICGGASLDTKYIEFFRSINIEVLNGYGITECSPVVAVNRNYFHKDGSVGQIVKDIEVKIINNEICVKGPIVMKGYYKDKKNTTEVIKDNYFHTGDLGYIDSDGFLFINGRVKNLIILSNGENIYPETIENELKKYEGICEIIISERNDRLIAIIYPQDTYEEDREYFENIIYKYNKNKPKNRQISYVEITKKEFKKNNNGKILRNEIKENI